MLTLAVDERQALRHLHKIRYRAIPQAVDRATNAVREQLQRDFNKRSVVRRRSSRVDPARTARRLLPKALRQALHSELGRTR